MASLNGVITFDPSSVRNLHISGAVADIIGADKVQPLYQKFTNFGTKVGDTPATADMIVHVASSAGTIRGFHALMAATGASTNLNFDLLVNGSSVLSALPTYNTSGTNVVKDGTLSTVALAANDVVRAKITVTTSTGATGPCCWVNITETQAPS